MGKTAKLELARRLIPLLLGILGAVGAVTFLTPVTGLLCWAAAVAVYSALPLPATPAGSIRPDPTPAIWTTDLIGFLVGVPLFSMALLGAFLASGGTSGFALLLLVPASLSIPIFFIAIRQRTSWVRFFGNGFEFAELGLRTRVRYVDLERAQVRERRARSALARLLAPLGSGSRRQVALLAGQDETRAMVFLRKDGTEFAISSEVIPDLQRVLIGMDRAGVDLPEGLSERERRKIRKKRERLYGRDDADMAEASPQEQVARIAALIEHARRQ